MLSILHKIREQVKRDATIRQDPAVQQVFFTLGQYHYLTYNWTPKGIPGQPLNWNAVEQAASIEPRVWEVLPAFVMRYSDLIQEKPNAELSSLIKLLETTQQNLPHFHGIAPKKYLHWIKRA